MIALMAALLWGLAFWGGIAGLVVSSYPLIVGATFALGIATLALAIELVRA